MYKWWIALTLAALGCGHDAPSEGTPFDLGAAVDMADVGVADATLTPDVRSSADADTPDLATSPDLTAAPDLPVMMPDVGVDAGPLTIGERCFADRAPSGGQFDGPNYDQFSPRVGSHCLGTNHQHIYGIEEVVFLGDSVTVGTPPTLSADFYRSRLADSLADKFNLAKPEYLWQLYDPTAGTAVQMESGNFRSCAKWGARTDDLLKGGEQIQKCFPDGGSDKRTLIVMTMGGNDISAITSAGGTEGRPLSEVQMMTEQAVADMREGIEWLTDPARFPNGSFVVFANPFEFTDGTGDTSACLAANLADLQAWDNPDDLADLVIWLNEQFMSIAVDTGTDMIFMLEQFCGHGWVATGPNADANARCYLGPGTDRWFDDTCIHPNPVGHGVIADMFMAVVNEIGSPP